jgi:hypothetical protein
MNSENLYIKIENGEPVSHPIVESNLRFFFPDFEPDNPPEGFAKFVRNPEPTLPSDSVIEKTTYEKSDDGIYSEYYHIKKVSMQEKLDIIDEFKNNNPLFANWVFDAEIDALVPPVPKPNDGKVYLWYVEKDGSGFWKEQTAQEEQNMKILGDSLDGMSLEDREEMFKAMKELADEMGMVDENSPIVLSDKMKLS